MLLPEDDFPIHQAPVGVAHVMDGHPNAYDRFWFNGIGEDVFFAVALGLYPNRGVIDGAFAVVHDGVQRSSLPVTHSRHDRRGLVRCVLKLSNRCA
jgi:hypothetical protein